MRPASRLAAAALRCRARIQLRFREQVADLRSLLAVLMLGAAVGSVLDLEVVGDDEEIAFNSIAQTCAAEQIGEILLDDSEPARREPPPPDRRI